MEDAKKERTKKARVVTRRVNELLNTIRIAASPDDVKEKANSLKTTIEELGTRHDEVMLLVEDDNAESLETEEKWYDDYYVRANQAIKEAGEYVKNNVPNIDHVNQTPPQVKLKKLEVPTFNGDYRNYFKWKELFEKYVKHLDEENKYYYLLNHTKGEANKLVTNKQSYHDAMESLDREFGNVNYIMKMLIDDIRSLYIVRKGDHKAFENLSREVNGFKDRLILMGKGEEAENSYILQEIESKLNNEDKQKWLEYLGDKVDDRKVDDICKWLENQSHIRRLTANQNPPIAWNRKSVTSSATKFESSSVCPLCKVAEHNISYCDNFLKSSNEERWEQVKQLYLCFICLSQGHRSFDCMAKKCEACHRPHHNLLHRWEGTYGKGENVPPGTINGNPTSYQTNTHKDNSMNLPLRTFLPIVRSRLKGNNNSVMATTLLDTGSEVNIVSKRMAKYLGLKGISITMVTVGVGGVSTQQITEKVELVIEDIMGKEISIEAIVLKKTCGNALSIPHEIVKDITNELQINPQRLYTKGGEIDLLLGMGVPQLHKQLRVHGDLNGLSIVETRFGPCLVGQAPPGFKGNYDTSFFNVQSLNDYVAARAMYEQEKKEKEQVLEEMKEVTHDRNDTKMELLDAQEQNHELRVRLETMLNEVADSVNVEGIQVKLEALEKQKAVVNKKIEEIQEKVDAWKEKFIDENDGDDRPDEINELLTQLNSSNKEMSAIEKNITVMNMLLDGSMPDDMQDDTDVKPDNNIIEELKKQHEKELDGCKYKNSELHTENDDLQLEIRELKAKVKELKDHDEDTVLFAVQKEADDASKKKIDLQAKIIAKKDETLTELRTKVDEKDDLFQKLERENEELKRYYKAEKEEQTEDMKVATEEGNAMKMELLDAQEQNNKLHVRLEIMLNEISDSVNVESIQMKFEALEKEKSDENKKIAKMQEKVDKWKERFMEENDGTEPTENDRSDEINKHLLDVNASNEKLLAIEKDITVMNMRLDGTLPDDMKQEDNAEKPVNVAIADLKKQHEKEVRQLKKELYDTKKENTDLESEKNELKSHNRELEGKIKELGACMNEIKSGEESVILEDKESLVNKEAVDKLNTALAESQARNEELQNEHSLKMEKMEKEHASELEVQKKSSHKLEKKLKQQQSAVVTLGEEKKEMKALQDKLKALEAKEPKLTKLQDVEKKYKELKQRYKKLEAKKTDAPAPVVKGGANPEEVKRLKKKVWNMGRILRTYPGKDQKVRSVQVRTQKKGVYDRPITKLGLLLSKKEFDDVKNKDGSSQEGGI